MQNQTGGHSLPRGEGVVGQKCMNFNTLSCILNIDRADGCSLRRNACNVTGLAEYTVQRVLCNGQGMQGDNACFHIEPLINIIGHEFIIYLLKNALREEDAFRSYATWPLTEALAEYYLKRIMGNTCFFDGQRQWRMFYEQQDQELTAVQLYRLALQEQIRS